MEFCIKGKAAGCPVWEIREEDRGYSMSNGKFVSMFDELRLPLELLQKTIRAELWKDTLIDAVIIIDRENFRSGEEWESDVRNWSRQDLIDYLMEW